MDGSEAIYVMNADGSDPLKVSGVDSPLSEPQWIPLTVRDLRGRVTCRER